MITETEAMIANARARFELLRRQDRELDGNDIALIRSECGVAMARAVVNLKGAAQWAVEYGERLGDTTTAQAAEIAALKANLARAATALATADKFIANGIELGYIRMPGPSTPDPAHQTLGVVRDALREAIR